MKQTKTITQLVDTPDLDKDLKFEIEDQTIEIQAVEKEQLVIPAKKYLYIEISDSKLSRLQANNISSFRASYIRCNISGSQLTGVQLPEGTFKNVVFQNCRMNLVNFRKSTFECCVFESCDLTETDFSGSSLTNVRFSDCRLELAEFSHCQNKQVEFADTSLADIKGVSGLIGTTITHQNLIEIATLLASEMNIQIDG